MTLRINDLAPDFIAETTEGDIRFHEWMGDGWAILFSHPKDFTPVCTTELGAVAGLKDEFEERGTKVIGISVDGVTDHKRWSEDIEKATGDALNFPLIGDPRLEIVKSYGMLPAEAGETAEGRTPADNATASTPVSRCRMPRRLRGSGTRAMSSSKPSGAGGTSANSPTRGSESSTTDSMGDDETAGTATPVNDETSVTTENHRPMWPCSPLHTPGVSRSRKAQVKESHHDFAEALDTRRPLRPRP